MVPLFVFGDESIEKNDMMDSINAEMTAGLPIALHVAYAFQILKNCDIKEKDNCPIYAQLRLLVMQQHKYQRKMTKKLSM